MAAAEESDRQLAAELQDLLSGLPNAPLPEVPDGADETAHVCLRRHLEPRRFDFAPKEHYELDEALGLLDFGAAPRPSGARFAVRRGKLARLARPRARLKLGRAHVRNHD